MGTVLDQDGAGRQQDQRGRPAQRGGAFDPAGQDSADGRHVVDTKIRRQQMGQHETRHSGGRHQAGNRIQAQLREAGKAGQQQRRKAEDGGQDAQAHGWPEALDPDLLVCALLFRLHEQVDGIVHRLADQRSAESQGDAVHRPETQADRGNACQRAARDRQQPQEQRSEGAIDQQQQGGDERDADEGKAADLVLDGVARGHREHAGTGHHEFRGRGGAGSSVERLSDRGHGALLGVGIGSRSARLQQHQGARAVAGGPGAIHQLRRRSAAELIQ